MSTANNRAAIQHWVAEGFNKQNLAEFDTLYSPALVDHALPPGLPPGREGRKLLASVFFTAFPDVHLHIEDTISEGDFVVSRWSAHGTHQGDLMGVSPTGKSALITGIAIDRFQEGQIVEHWEVMDQFGLMQQLGAIPTGA